MKILCRHGGGPAFHLIAAILAVFLASGLLPAAELAAGTKWATPYYIVEGAQPGPTVLLTGGLHGDEPAGARAAEQIRHWPITRGRLVIVPRANEPGLAAGTRHLPGIPRGEHDLNRNFPRSDETAEARTVIARAIWKLARKEHPDWVIDLHEGYHFHQIQPKSVGSTILDANSGTGINMSVVSRMLEAINGTVPEEKKRFVRLRGTANGSLARAAAERLGARALILETTTREQALSLRTRQHRIMVRSLFEQLGILKPGGPTLASPDVPAETLKAALYDAGGTTTNGPRDVRKVMNGLPSSLLWRIGPADIREGALRNFDLVIFPGGSGSKQATALQPEGREQIRTFVEKGGGFVGICAGSYLAAANYAWSLKISNHRTFCEMQDIPGAGRRSMWYRGPSQTVTMELSDEGRKILGGSSRPLPVRYHNGPIVSPAGLAGLPSYRVLASFRREVVLYEPQRGTMINSPAIIASTFGLGRVLCISPHPESSPTLRPLVANGIRWAGGR